VLLPETDIETAAIIADLFRSEVESNPWPQREVTASFGVAELNIMMRSGGELVSAADAALYRSKENGRNQVTIAE
jgi:diguanylate cyclase (GGDEF)-like protein